MMFIMAVVTRKCSNGRVDGCVGGGVLTLGDVEIEEVGVEKRLQRSSRNGNRINVAVEVIPVDPVHDVECSVSAEEHESERGDV